MFAHEESCDIIIMDNCTEFEQAYGKCICCMGVGVLELSRLRGGKYIANAAAVRGGKNEHIAKPVDMEKLKDLMSRFLQ